MNTFLPSAIKLFAYYKALADKSIQRLSDEQLQYTAGNETNSVAIIMKHLAGNMLSRWTDFLNSDGEKPWRNRDDEFVMNEFNHHELMAYWEKGWMCLFDALQAISESDLTRTVYIRNEGHSVTDAIQRQTAHYAYHVGQIVFISKMLCKDWQSLSIPRLQSSTYNTRKFGEEKGERHFTDGV